MIIDRYCDLYDSAEFDKLARFSDDWVFSKVAQSLCGHKESLATPVWANDRQMDLLTIQIKSYQANSVLRKCAGGE